MRDFLIGISGFISGGALLKMASLAIKYFDARRKNRQEELVQEVSQSSTVMVARLGIDGKQIEQLWEEIHRQTVAKEEAQNKLIESDRKNARLEAQMEALLDRIKQLPPPTV